MQGADKFCLMRASFPAQTAFFLPCPLVVEGARELSEVPLRGYKFP